MITHYFSAARSRKMQILDAKKAGSWCHAVTPTDSDIEYLAETFGLDRNILNDATDIYEAPRVETDENATYVFTRFCHPDGENTSTEPLLVIYTDTNIVTVMRTQDQVLDNLINNTIDILTTQKTKIFLHILDEINKSYRGQLNLVSKQILKFRSQMRHTDINSEQILKFIELEEDLYEFLSALQPQALVLTALESGKYMQLYEDDRDMVEDIMLSTSELIELSKSRVRTVSNIRQAYDVIATNNLNRTFRRLTSIAIFMAIPTVIGGLWGMNVAVPFHAYPHAFSVVMVIIGISVLGAVGIFRSKRWI
ncbi:hypothetical protein A3F37_00575 [Candidatus Saccharibacteria bacterium RIFCSPHIGHO2_12_FULL_41_12]|nr:MAG: hypothetical protein A3F37_00575 [Candidatus Saccharibacteria bacterium RIFCSPHIGHO2_12_FULL_41_12]